ncbi:hypothetical protein C8R44DRAFT_293393 [Mycena epipterygia]|nr:hypothetical protein C8R44DRAFT_293393 [Mycena epipterygia]
MSPRMHTPTNFDAHISDLVMAFAIGAIVFIVLTLGAYAWAAWNPISRPHLNRVSFRLLVYALVANLIYAISMIAGTRLTAGAACNFNAFFANTCLMFAGIMFFCMALNLQLVLVHGVNGRKMERYYVLGGLILPVAFNCPSYAAGALGFYEANSTCWFNSRDPAVQLRWFVGTQAVWMFFMSACEVMSFLTIVGYMVVCHRITSGVAGTVTSSFPRPPTIPKPPIVLYRKIIMRIGLYPFFSCFFNITGCLLDLHQVQHPDLSQELNWRLGIVDLLIYVLRPLMYALLAATDPSFLHALHALRRPASDTAFYHPDPTQVRVGLQCNTANTLSSSVTGSVDSTPRYGELEAGNAPKPEESTSVDVDHNPESVPDVTRQI